MPWYMISSGISLAPASIITTLPMVAATVTSIWEVFFCSWLGFMTILPSQYPTSMQPMGPAQGMSEQLRQADTPIMAVTSGEQS